MKKLVLMLITLVVLSIKGYSQTSSDQGLAQKILGRMEFGLTAGGNLSNFTSAGFPTDALPGFQAGITVAYKFTDNLMVQEEFL